MEVLTGEIKVLLPESRTKVVAVHAGPFQLLEPSKVLIKEGLDNLWTSLSNNLLIAHHLVPNGETMVAKEVSTTMPSDMLIITH